MATATLEKLIWVLIYGGLLIVSLGLFVKREDFETGWMLVAGGAALAVLGAALIWLRSRRET